MNILDIIKKDYSNVPYFDHNRAVLSAPVRHIFMMSTIEYLKKNNHKKIKLLEIGSWFGASTLTWAQAIDTFFGEQNEIHFALCKRTLSPARHVLKGTSYQNQPKLEAGGASLLMGSIN